MEKSKVDAVLELDNLSVKYHVEMTPDETLEFVERADTYNNFTSDILAKLIREINQIIPPMKFQKGNPNNGRSHHMFIVGNEGSRVIYLHISKFYLRKEFQGTPFDYKSLEKQLKLLAKQAKADEFYTVRNDDITFEYRFWWD